MKNIRDQIQDKSIQEILKTSNRTNKIILSLATGVGKTQVFARLSQLLINKTKKKVLILAHREELLLQARARFKALNPNLIIHVDQGENKIKDYYYKTANVIVASAATLGRKDTARLNIYNPDDFCLVVVDECHRALSSGYIRVFEHFGLSKHPILKGEPEIKHQRNYKRLLKKFGETETQQIIEAGYAYNWNNNCLLLGVTATPIRTKSGETLKSVFDKMAFNYGLAEAIRDGVLCNIHNISVKTTTDLSKVKIKNGDYAEGELSQTVNTPKRNQLIIDTYKTKAQQGSTIVFAVDLQHNQSLKNTFLDNGIHAEVVDSLTSTNDRQRILQDFRDDKIPVLINVGVLVEGFDAPNTRNILMARPTQSLIFYSQAIGRGTRTHEGKEYVTIIDFVDNAAKNNPLVLSKILDLPDGSLDAQPKVKKAIEEVAEKGSGKLASLEEIVDFEIIDQGFLVELIKEVESGKIQNSKYTWYQTFTNTWILPLPKFAKISGIDFKKSKFILERNWEDWHLSFEGTQMDNRKLVSNIGIHESIKSLDTWIETTLLQNSVDSRFLTNGKRKWHGDIASEGQIKFIYNLLRKYPNRLSTDDLSKLTKGEAAALINILQTKQ